MGLTLSFVFVFLVILSCSKPPEKKVLDFQRIQQIPFETVLEQAKKQNKLIFVDVYTVWCGPCKYMDEKVFTAPSVIEKFNRDLIPFKVNAEDADGVAFASKYKVNAYPTFLFLKPNGEVLLRLDGVFTPEMLISEAEFAMKEFVGK
ncbi:thioredoxin fold domain-containing protein [Emticicia sp. CRIBPO]|uniref:thioredoxin family protein n=1 Tax=Emticicia sp. CRIBPO TaxID=2683258 RepID=UPI001411FC18|nr:thioredoxin family protein [Emticicia sp. CRIBPO]NBA85019.1 thioredoxin fold domain-containing protein [Emticicia sp. CRIBPO]